jgi:hypothetical protein
MATINDFIAQQVRNLTGGVQIPAASRDQVLNGMSSSVLGSLTQTVARPGGMDQISALLTGKTSAAASPVTQLAGNLFSTNILSKLNLPPALSSTLSGIIPQVMGKLSGFLRDRDGDGDVDLNDILLSLRGNSGATGGGLLGGAAKSILGSILKK